MPSPKLPPLNVAMIGCGMISQTQHLPNVTASANCRLHTCCDTSAPTLARVQERFRPARVTADFQEAVRDPAVDLVFLATTEKVRLPVIAAAAAAGKPVYCEKPLARSLAEMYEIQQVVHQAGIPFCVGHNRRSAPAMLAAHGLFRRHMTQPAPCAWRFDREGAARPRLTADGVAGMSVRINDDWWSWKSWAFDKEQSPHGPMLFEMTHFTDLCNWLLAAEPVEVVALAGSVLNHGVVVRYRTGEVATILIASNGTFGYPKELYEMFGNGGAVVVDHLLELRTAGIASGPARQVFPLLRDRFPGVGSELGLSGWLAKQAAACAEAAARQDPSLVLGAGPDKGWAHHLDRFVDEICGNGPVVCDVDSAVWAMRVAMAAVQAAAEHRAVRLEEV